MANYTSSSRILLLSLNNAEKNNPHANRNNPTLRRLQQQLSNDSSTTPTNPPECAPPEKPAKTFHQPSRSEIDTEQKRILGPVDGRRFHYAAKTKNLDGSALEFSGDEFEILSLLLLKLGKPNNLTTSDEQCPDHVKRHIVYYNSECTPNGYSMDHDFAIDTCGDNSTIPPNLVSDADIVCDGEQGNSYEKPMTNSSSDYFPTLPLALVVLLLLVFCSLRPQRPTPIPRREDEQVPLLNSQRIQASEGSDNSETSNPPRPR